MICCYNDENILAFIKDNIVEFMLAFLSLPSNVESWINPECSCCMVLALIFSFFFQFYDVLGRLNHYCSINCRLQQRYLIKGNPHSNRMRRRIQL